MDCSGHRLWWLLWRRCGCGWLAGGTVARLLASPTLWTLIDVAVCGGGSVGISVGSTVGQGTPFFALSLNVMRASVAVVIATFLPLGVLLLYCCCCCCCGCSSCLCCS